MSVRFRAPGRVNLIGSHTDAHEGFVLPVALSLQTEVTVAATGSETVRVESDGYASETVVPADGSAGPDAAPRGWSRYVAAVVWALSQAGRPPVGGSFSVLSSVPAGAGLSSSAAFEVALALALNHVAGWSLAPLELARVCRRAEAEGVGVPCGIMDQAIACLGSQRGATFLDCRTLRHREVPLPSGQVVVVADSGARRRLDDGRYAERRRDLDEGLARIRGQHQSVTTLRDANLDMIRELPDLMRRRCRHVITENARVLRFAEALDSGDVAEAGRLLDESHASDVSDYEASHPAVDALADRLRSTAGVAGARMTGGGFGGMVVALATERAAERIRSQLGPDRVWVATGAPPAGRM